VVSLADLVLVVHFLFVIFVVGGFLAVLLGAWRGWVWVRHRCFRQLHLAAIGFVALTSTAGYICPLTILEDRLRGVSAAPRQGFIARWISHLLYYDFPEWVFTSVYLLFGLLVLATYWLVPPGSRRKGC